MQKKLNRTILVNAFIYVISTICKQREIKEI